MYIVDIDIFEMLIFLKVFTRRKAPYLPLFSSWGGNCFTRSANEAFGWHVRALWALGDKLFHTGANEALIGRRLQFFGCVTISGPSHQLWSHEYLRFHIFWGSK